MEAELRKVKVSRQLSEETTAFTAQLWVDGEHVGNVKNAGQGGNNQLTPAGDGEGWAKIHAFEEWCKTLPAVEDDRFGTLKMDSDFYLSRMLDAYEETKQLQRWCKTKTVIRLKGGRDDEYATYKKPYSPEFAEYVRKTEPDLAEIINERYL